MRRRGVPLRPPVRRVAIPPSAEPEPELIEDILEDELDDRGGAFSTRRQYWRGVVWLLIALGIQLVASLMPTVVEAFYSRQLYYYLSRYMSIPSRFLGFPLGELLFALMILWFVLWGGWYLRRSIRRETRLFDVIKVFFLHVLWVFSILIPIFLFVWGFNYQRLQLADTLGLERRPATQAGELQGIALQVINGVNSGYDTARAGQDWQGASKLTLTRAKLYQVLETGFQNEKLMGPASHGGYGDPKPLKLSKVAGWMGISGFYIAYTTEVTFNEFVPDCDLPMVIAHHKAHQRGYAREDEANFIGYLICTKSPDPYVRYSGYLYGLKLIEPLAESERVRYDALLSRLGPGPRTDLEKRAQYWGFAKNSYLGPFTRGAFNAYLRANRVQGGIKNYDEDVYLLTSYYLKNPAPPTPAATTPAEIIFPAEDPEAQRRAPE